MIVPKRGPSFADFVRWLSDRGCRSRLLEGNEEPPVWEIERTVGDRVLDYQIAIYDDWPVETTVVRSICRRLEISDVFVTGWE